MMRPIPSDERFQRDTERWAALRSRDAGADGAFFYSVRSTGVYCYPSCAARAAQDANVAFHATREDAEAAGFRPCRRCRPDLPPRSQREAALVAAACETINRAEEPPSLNAMARAAGCSPAHFHRLFRRITGITPKGYADARRQVRVQTALAAGVDVTAAFYQAGFNSSGRFYEAADSMLGMAPKAYRSGGAGETIRHASGRCSLGWILVAASARGICAILLGDDPASLASDLEARFPRALIEEGRDGFAEVLADAVHLVDDPAGGHYLSLPMDVRGTAFQRRVWEVLRAIPSGTTLSYAEVATRIGKPKATRAVAAACAANRLAVAVPCHRVVAATGGLAGYRWGIERKRQLLEREKAAGLPSKKRSARRGVHPPC